ncbi:hypothetical protein LOZ65_000525 [Ophidiomyces ophidiicola]|nr:hypothetical protein LOZ65_000525 [Ophidiomyces ophidiicola]
MDSNGTDPFLQVQTDLLAALNNTRPLFSSYQRIRSLATSANNPELVQAREELEATLHELNADLEDLVDSVRAIENDPYRFGIELDEIERRRRLVEDVGSEIGEMRDALQRTTRRASNANNNNVGAAGGKHGHAVLPNPADFDNVHGDEEDGGDHDDDYYAEMEHQRQLELMQEQDEQLDGVFQTVGNLRQQASDMGRELEEQAVILDDVDTLADRVGGKLQSGVRRVGHIIKRNEGIKTSFLYDVELLHRGVDYGVDFAADSGYRAMNLTPPVARPSPTTYGLTHISLSPCRLNLLTATYTTAHPLTRNGQCRPQTQDIT